MADFADRAVAVIGGDVDQDGGAARPVAFEHDFFDLAAFQFAGAAHDGLLDVVGRHADTLLAARMAVRRRGLPSGSPPLRAAIVISLMMRVNAFPRLASVSRLFVLNGGPFGMA